MVPLAALPLWLRREVLGLCSDGSDETLKYRQEVMLRAEPFLLTGFPQAIREPEPRRRLVALTRIAAGAGIVIALASAGIISALALGSSHPPHSLTAARTSTSPPASPTEVVEQQAPAAPAASAASAASATTTKPAPSHSASSSASPLPRPSLSPSTPAPTPTPTPIPAPTPTFTVSPCPRSARQRPRPDHGRHHSRKSPKPDPYPKGRRVTGLLYFPHYLVIHSD